MSKIYIEIPYIENLPLSWKFIPNRFLFLENKNKVGDNFSNYQLLSLTTSGVKEKDINSTGGKVPESYENYLAIKKNQMVFCLFDLDVSAVFSGISRFDGMITSAYNAYDSTSLINNDYADYWFQYVFTNRYYMMYSKNIRYSVTGQAFKSLYTPVPPIDIQNKIVSILHNKTRKINQLIQNQQQQIEKLKEYKQSLISEVVTKGLDPNVEYKDSGIEWIDMIPAKASICKIKNLYNIDLGKMLTNVKTSENDTLENYLKAKNIQWNYINIDDISKMWFSQEDKDKLLLNEGDILVAEGGAAGTTSIYRNEFSPCYIQNAVHRINRKDNNLNKYLYYWMFNIVNRGYIDYVCNKATIMHYTKEKVSDTPIIRHSSNLQIKIVDFLDQKCNMVDELISIKEEKIHQLTQFKKSLIYEYVTGKKEAS